MTTNLSNLFMLSENISRSISAENPHGEKGKGAMEIPADEANPAFDLGRGWTVSYTHLDVYKRQRMD